MKDVDDDLKVRYAVQIVGLSKRAVARRFGFDPRTVDKMMTFSVPRGDVRSKPPQSIEAREKPVRAKTPVSVAPKRKRGRPKKGDVVAAKEPRRRERQASQTLPQMLADLPKRCNIGTKCNAKGQTTGWTGYKARSVGRRKTTPGHGKPL